MQFPDICGRTGQEDKEGRSLGLLMELRGKAVRDIKGAGKEL